MMDKNEIKSHLDISYNHESGLIPIATRELLSRADSEIRALRHLLEPFSLAYRIAKSELGEGSNDHLDAVAKLYVRLIDFKSASEALSAQKEDN